MVAEETPEPPQFQSVEWLERELEKAQYQNSQWERLLELVCHDRDSWQQQCETLETIVVQQRNKIKELLGYERTVVIDTKFSEGELAVSSGSGCSFRPIPQIYLSQEAKQPVQGFVETIRDKGQDTGETPGSGQAGGESEGLVA